MLSLRKRQTETIVPVDTCELMPNPMQPRRQFDDPALRELAASIRTHGVLQPVIVCPADPMPYPDNIRGASFEIIAGERRWRAASGSGVFGKGQPRGNGRGLRDPHFRAEGEGKVRKLPGEPLF